MSNLFDDLHKKRLASEQKIEEHRKEYQKYHEIAVDTLDQLRKAMGWESGSRIDTDFPEVDRWTLHYYYDGFMSKSRKIEVRLVSETDEYQKTTRYWELECQTIYSRGSNRTEAKLSTKNDSQDALVEALKILVEKSLPQP